MDRDFSSVRYFPCLDKTPGTLLSKRKEFCGKATSQALISSYLCISSRCKKMQTTFSNLSTAAFYERSYRSPWGVRPFLSKQNHHDDKRHSPFACILSLPSLSLQHKDSSAKKMYSFASTEHADLG